MATEIRIVLRPQVENGFTPTSFSDLLQQQVSFPGLDQSYVHTLVGVDVAPDGSRAELMIHSEPMHRVQLGAAMRPSFGAPPARIKAFDTDGNELHIGSHPSPLRVFEMVAIGDLHYRVAATDWPNRDPNTGACVGDIDWQHVVLQPIPNPVPEPAPFTAPGGAPTP
ncbi:MAG: hypothetical protein JWO67_3180 [Streptosporangiaceae bacterium]|nr:hypothetical protein [Streptosporangiaceae bacterium]